MKNIYVTTPEAFVQHGTKIGILLYNNPNKILVNFYTGENHIKVNRSKLSTPTNESIEKTLNRNEELRELAFENNLIELHSQDSKSYLNYVSTYN
jgi:hypothetical protein